MDGGLLDPKIFWCRRVQPRWHVFFGFWDGATDGTEVGKALGDVDVGVPVVG